MNLNGLYRKLNEMQFDFDLVGKSPTIAGLKETP
jgi:hypothetical protein